jgi:hypothetical protein
VLAAAALILLASLTNLLLVELPSGLLSLYIDSPWLLGRGS